MIQRHSLSRVTQETQHEPAEHQTCPLPCPVISGPDVPAPRKLLRATRRFRPVGVCGGTVASLSHLYQRDAVRKAHAAFQATNVWMQQVS